MSNDARIDIYMLFGGTNWGNTAEPTVYSSYDYGGGINENHVLTPKMAEMRLQGSFLRVSRDLFKADYVGNGTGYTTSLGMELFTQELRNEDTDAGFYFVRHADGRRVSTDITTTQLQVDTSIGALTIPQNGSMTIQGHGSIKASSQITYSVFPRLGSCILHRSSFIPFPLVFVARIMTWSTVGSIDYVLVYAMAGQSAKTALQFQSDQQPTIDTQGSDNNVTATWSESNGTLTLNYAFTAGAASFVQLTSSTGNKNIVLMILEKSVANTWHAVLLPGTGTFGNYFSVGTNTTVLVGGWRTTQSLKHLLSLNLKEGSVTMFDVECNIKLSDLNGTTTIDVIPPPPPPGVRRVMWIMWNSEMVAPAETGYGSLRGVVDGLEAPVLPQLGPWKVMGALPEINASFDDSAFITADQMSTNITALPPLTPGPVLYSQQYGFFGGIQLYRGHFTATGEEALINIPVQGGDAFGYPTFLNGIFLGSSQGTPTISLTSASWNIPNGTVDVGSDNVFTVVMDHMGMVETSTNSGKEPRGIRGITIVGGNTTFSSWKIQGNLGGNTQNPDVFRGYLNEGGLYPERIGAHLPGFEDSKWQKTDSLSVTGAGINFFRTTFSLSDVPIRLSFTPSVPTANYRARIYINGWMLGEYINNIGPQTIFVLPSGIVHRHAPNTLALALWSLDEGGAQANVELISDGTFSSSNSFVDWTDAPTWQDQRANRQNAEFYPPM